MPITQPNATQITFSQAGSGSVVRTAQSKMRDIISVLDFGADPTGAADASSTILNAAGANTSLYFPAGTYKIAANITVPVPVIFAAGSSLTILAGVTVTLSGGISAPLTQVFSGAGTVVFSGSPVTGYPEWWGAVINSSATAATSANQIALPACHIACANMVLANADYWYSSTLTFATSYRTIQGHYGDYSGQGHGTRLILTTSNAKTQTQAILGVYPVPASNANATWSLCVKDVAFIRDDGAYPITPPATAGYLNSVWGVIFAGNVFSSFEHINVGGAQASWVNGCDRTFIDDCYFQRGANGDGTNPSNDWMYGLIVGGPATNYGFIGANASVYVRRCEAAGSNTQVNPTGLYIVGYFGDTFIQGGFESAALANGILVDGQSLSAASAHQDLHIEAPVLDGCSVYGLSIKNTNTASLIDITDPYIEVNGSGQGFYTNNALGMITLLGGQIIGGGGSGTNGITLLSSNSVDIRGTKIRECGQPVYTNNVYGCNIEPNIFNGSVSIGEAIALAGLFSRGYVRPLITGSSNMFTNGIACLGTGAVYSEFNLTRINPGSFGSGSGAYKLAYNGSNVAASTFGTGNVVSGVTS